MADRTVRLEDRDNFRAFKLVVEGSRAGLEAARAALAGTAELADADTAWVLEAALRGRPEVAVTRLAAGAHRHDREGAAARLDRRRPQGHQGARGVALKRQPSTAIASSYSVLAVSQSLSAASRARAASARSLARPDALAGSA